MKHLKKKYILKVQLPDDVIKVMDDAVAKPEELQAILENENEGYYGLAVTADNVLLQTFKYTENGKIFMIPEPDPVVIYFDSARNFFKQISEHRSKIFENLTNFDHNVRATNGDFYWYFSLASSYAIFLFTAIEAFINKLVPADYTYSKRIQDKRTEVYDRLQVQRQLDFGEKLKKVLPDITGKNFVGEFTHKYQQIIMLKEFRDEIIHTKNYNDTTTPNHHENLYATSLGFEFDKTLTFVKDFINYYEKDLIEPCPCDREY